MKFFSQVTLFDSKINMWENIQIVQKYKSLQKLFVDNCSVCGELIKNQVPAVSQRTFAFKKFSLWQIL